MIALRARFARQFCEEAQADHGGLPLDELLQGGAYSAPPRFPVYFTVLAARPRLGSQLSYLLQ